MESNDMQPKTEPQQENSSASQSDLTALGSTNDNDWLKAAYEKSVDVFKTIIDTRRKDMFYITALQVATITIIKEDVTRYSYIDLSGFSLIIAIIGLFSALVGLNNERRMNALNQACQEIGRKIEGLKSSGNMKHIGLFMQYNQTIDQFRVVVKNKVAFGVYYAFLICGWLLLLAANFTKHKL